MKTAREETTRLADLLRREHHAMADFLAALAEFDRERRWAELGYTSLFIFLVRELRLSKGAAFYRNRAAELIQKMPQVLEPLRDGRLCLSSVAELASVLTPENVEDVLPRFFHLSRSGAKEVTAELRPDPAPALRTVVTALPAATLQAVLPVAGGFLEDLGHANSSVLDGARREVKTAAVVPPARADVEPMTAELRRLHLTVSRRLLEKLAAARDALSHSHPSASDDEILEVGLDLIVERHRKRRGIGSKPRKPADTATAASWTKTKTRSKSKTKTKCRVADAEPQETSANPPPQRSRHVPAAVWRAVWARDGGRCAWPLENGGVCGSTRQVELDHVHGWALGAATTADDCRLLCRAHQDVSARALYGDDLMNRYTCPKDPRCSEPVAAWGCALMTPVFEGLTLRSGEGTLGSATSFAVAEETTGGPCSEHHGLRAGRCALRVRRIVGRQHDERHRLRYSQNLWRDGHLHRRRAGGLDPRHGRDQLHHGDHAHRGERGRLLLARPSSGDREPDRDPEHHHGRKLLHRRRHRERDEARDLDGQRSGGLSGPRLRQLPDRPVAPAGDGLLQRDAPLAQLPARGTRPHPGPCTRGAILSSSEAAWVPPGRGPS